MDIRITDFHVAESLSGLLLYPMNFDVMAFALNAAEERVKKMWGEPRPVLVCPPQGGLPKRVCHAWLSGPERDPADHGTHLIVTWFCDEIPEDPLKSALHRVAERGGWKALSEGFEY